jgi:DNA-binding response OmpR family regulator
MINSCPKILLVDAEDMLRQATAMMLSKNGGRVHSAATLDEALEYASEFVYDVTVVDESSESPRAAEVVERMRELGCRPGRVVVCTADPAPDAGADVIPKPFPFERLVEAVFGAAGARRRTHSGLYQRVSSAAPRRPVRMPVRASRARRDHG